MLVLVLLSIELLLLDDQKWSLLLTRHFFFFLTSLLIGLAPPLHYLVKVLLSLFFDDDLARVNDLLAVCECIGQAVENLHILDLLIDFWYFTLVDHLLSRKQLGRQLYCLGISFDFMMEPGQNHSPNFFVTEQRSDVRASMTLVLGVLLRQIGSNSTLGNFSLSYDQANFECAITCENLLAVLDFSCL